MLDRDRADIRQRYRSRWEEFGYDSRTLGWNKDCQWVRFDAAVEGVQTEEMESVLDVGCGFGDLLGFLRERGWRGRYFGVDLVEELVAEARREYAADSAAEFLCADIHDAGALPVCGMAVALGLFNHHVEGGNEPLIRDTIAAMWRASSSVVVCDFLSLSSDPDRRESRLHYHDPADAYRLGAAYSKRVMIHHAYMPFEFQLKIWRDDSFETAAPVFAPRRDLARAQTAWREKRRAH
jgi:SAM-dependent methyltransferase